MPIRNSRSKKTEKIFVIAAFKDSRQIGYLFWQTQMGSPKTLQVANPASSLIATFSTYQRAEFALNDRVAGKLMTAKDSLQSLGYDLEIVEFG